MRDDPCGRRPDRCRSSRTGRRAICEDDLRARKSRALQSGTSTNLTSSPRSREMIGAAANARGHFPRVEARRAGGRMYTLPHQLEFLSDAWLDEARGYLERQIEQRRALLGDRPFSVSERFTHAPPHLRFPDGVAQWRVHYD